MKDEIVKLKGILPQPGFIKVHDTFITWNENDSLEALELIIGDTNLPIQKKVTKPRKFFIQTNSLPISPLVFTPSDIVIQNFPPVFKVPSGTGKAALYQFPVSFEDFSEGSNAITFYEAYDLGDSKNSAIVPDATLPQNDGTVVDLIILGSITFKALINKNELHVKLERPGIDETPDKILWNAIKKHSLKFSDYADFIDVILCKKLSEGSSTGFSRKQAKNRSPFVNSEEYNLIKFATEFFMLKKSGLSQTELQGYVGTSGKLPYYDFVIQRITDELRFDNLSTPYEGGGNDCDDRESERLFNPFMIELIWSYWMEQGMLVQTMNVINLRFQNIRTDVYSDRLQRFDVDPLRPLNYILWGHIQDEQHRLSLPRRVNEYNHEYGLLLTGRAVQKLNAVDSRVKFLEAFHNLLNLSFIYFKESDDTTYIADAFPVLNALREVHLMLAEGNHNAYGNLTWTARQEMMIQQYILARPEMRDFLGGRTMVPYPEKWMDRVDSMRNIQGWGETSILHYYELAMYGEQVILSIRYGNWSDPNLDRTNAANWAQEFRNPIYRYTHAYRVVTGVDLTTDKVQANGTFALQPSYLMQQRLASGSNVNYMPQQQRLPVSRRREGRA